MSTLKLIGKCSVCGGQVVEGSPAYCLNCRAVEAGSGPVIEMVPAQHVSPFMIPIAPVPTSPPWRPSWYEVTCESVEIGGGPLVGWTVSTIQGPLQEFAHAFDAPSERH